MCRELANAVRHSNKHLSSLFVVFHTNQYLGLKKSMRGVFSLVEEVNRITECSLVYLDKDVAV